MLPTNAAFHYACCGGSTNPAALLAAHGADTAAKANNGWIPASCAASSDGFSTLKHFVEKKANRSAHFVIRALQWEVQGAQLHQLAGCRI